MRTLAQEIDDYRTLNYTRLSLKGLALTSIPKEVFELEGMRVLDLSYNNLATLPREISRLRELRSLDLTHNNITSLPEQFSDLAGLQTLNISSNNLSGLQNEIFGLKALVWLYVENNQLSSVSNNIGRLTNLAGLNVSRNVFEVFPSAISLITSLRDLTIDGNSLKDIPDLIGSLVNLRHFSIARNGLTSISTEIGQLVHLRTLNLSHNMLTGLPEELGHLRVLEKLDVSSNRLTSLPKGIGVLRKLEVDGGLSFDGNPLTYPYPALTWAGQPGTTYNVLSWLRGELDDEYPPKGDEPSLTDPPTLPPQTSRPFVEIDTYGEIQFVPPEALDGEGNNVPQLRRLHPALRSIAQEMCSAMPKGGNSEHPTLARRCESYSELINCSLNEVDFGRLYLEGVRLENARRIDDAEVQSGNLARLPAEAEEAIDSLLKGHASFILATAVGVQGIEAEAAYEATPEDRRLARAEAKNLASKLIEARNISPEVKEVLQQTSIEDSPKAERRANMGEHALLRNVTAAVIVSAALASPPLVGLLVFGPAGTIVGGATALPILEGLKKTKLFGRARDYLSDRIDRITEEEAQHFLLRAREGRASVQRLERAFWRVASRSGFEWLGPWLEWLSGRDR